VDNVYIELDALELPILDGFRARPFIEDARAWPGFAG